MPPCIERHRWTSKDGRKFLEKIFNFFEPRVSEYPESGTFCGIPARRDGTI